MYHSDCSIGHTHESVGQTAKRDLRPSLHIAWLVLTCVSLPGIAGLARVSRILKWDWHCAGLAAAGQSPGSSGDGRSAARARLPPAPGSRLGSRQPGHAAAAAAAGGCPARGTLLLPHAGHVHAWPLCRYRLLHVPFGSAILDYPAQCTLLTHAGNVNACLSAGASPSPAPLPDPLPLSLKLPAQCSLVLSHAGHVCACSLYEQNFLSSCSAGVFPDPAPPMVPFSSYSIMTAQARAYPHVNACPSFWYPPAPASCGTVDVSSAMKDTWDVFLPIRIQLARQLHLGRLYSF